MDLAGIDIDYYLSLLQPDPPDNTTIPTTSMLLDDSSVFTPSTLTLNEFPDYLYPTVDNFRTSSYNRYNPFRIHRNPTKYVFDLSLLIQSTNNNNSENSYSSVTTVSTIRTSDVFNTADYPVPVTYKQRQAYSEKRLLTPFGFITRPPLSKDRYYSTRNCSHNKCQVYYYDNEVNDRWGPIQRRFLYTRPTLNTLSKGCYNPSSIDKPTRYYLERLNSDSYRTKEHYKEGYNCYTVVPVPGNRTLQQHQYIGRIGFSDSTTYYSTYAHTRKAGSDKLPAIRDNNIKITYQNQSQRFYYYTEVGIHRDTGEPANDYRNIVKNNYKVKLHTSDFFVSIGNPFWREHVRKHRIRGEPPLEYIYESNKHYKTKYKYLARKVPLVKDPVHPFCLTHDHPHIYRTFIRKPHKIKKKLIGHFSLPYEHWVTTPNFMHDADDRTDKLNWIYKQLSNIWVKL